MQSYTNQFSHKSRVLFQTGIEFNKCSLVWSVICKNITNKYTYFSTLSCKNETQFLICLSLPQHRKLDTVGEIINKTLKIGAISNK